MSFHLLYVNKREWRKTLTGIVGEQLLLVCCVSDDVDVLCQFSVRTVTLKVCRGVQHATDKTTVDCQWTGRWTVAIRAVRWVRRSIQRVPVIAVCRHVRWQLCGATKRRVLQLFDVIVVVMKRQWTTRCDWCCGSESVIISSCRVQLMVIATVRCRRRRRRRCRCDVHLRRVDPRAAIATHHCQLKSQQHVCLLTLTTQHKQTH